MTRVAYITALAALPLTLLVGCSDATKKPAMSGDEASVVLEGPAEAWTGPSAADADGASIALSDEVARSCNLPEPHFAFDSAAVRDPATDHLEALTRCLTEGPLEGRNIALTGHADQRGPSSYNLALGQRRAARVERFLVSNGVKASRIATSSRGEMEAEAGDGYADDRRVEVTLRD